MSKRAQRTYLVPSVAYPTLAEARALLCAGALATSIVVSGCASQTDNHKAGVAVTPQAELLDAGRSDGPAQGTSDAGTEVPELLPLPGEPPAPDTGD